MEVILGHMRAHKRIPELASFLFGIRQFDKGGQNLFDDP